MMGMKVKPSALREIIDEIDQDGSGLLEFGEFCTLAAKFLVEEDEEALKKELKEAFRIYDKECMGYISTETLKEILRELDNKLTEEDLDSIIAEVDVDGSGTLDFDEFMEMMARALFQIAAGIVTGCLLESSSRLIRNRKKQ